MSVFAGNASNTSGYVLIFSNPNSSPCELVLTATGGAGYSISLANSSSPSSAYSFPCSTNGNTIKFNNFQGSLYASVQSGLVLSFIASNED